jgi:hypothetical protein
VDIVVIQAAVIAHTGLKVKTLPEIEPRHPSSRPLSSCDQGNGPTGRAKFLPSNWADVTDETDDENPLFPPYPKTTFPLDSGPLQVIENCITSGESEP